MKLRIFPFSKQMLLPLLIFALFGCDQDDTPDYNYFKVGDKEYKIEECVVYKYYVRDTSEWFGIKFFDKKIEFMNTDASPFIVTNTNGVNCLDFSDCSYSNRIKEGTYIIGYNEPFYGHGSGSGYSNFVGQFYFCSFGLNWNSNDLKFENLNSLYLGELTLVSDGNNFDIKFKCQADSGNMIEGFFSGVPIKINF